MKSYSHGGTEIRWVHLILDEDGDVLEQRTGGTVLRKLTPENLLVAHAQYQQERMTLIGQLAADPDQPIPVHLERIRNGAARRKTGKKILETLAGE